MATFGKLTPRLAWCIAAPHTWPASILPCLVGICYCASQTGTVHVGLSLMLLAICVFFQAAVNTFNDYFDYVKGADTAKDNLEVDDSVLVNYHINPKSALTLGIVYLVIPFALGICLIVLFGWIPLAIALVGALIVVLYSAGKTPISYLPIGEFVSGFVMGGLIPLGVGSVLLTEFSFMPLLVSIPQIILVGLIMQTNNTCDIEKDIESSRKTMPVLVGRATSRKIYHVLLVIALLACIVTIALLFCQSWWILVFMVLSAWPVMKPLWNNPLLPTTRIPAMGAICSCNVIIGAFYCMAMLCTMVVVPW